MFDETFSAPEVEGLLQAAIGLTAPDYLGALEGAIADLQAGIPGTGRR